MYYATYAIGQTIFHKSMQFAGMIKTDLITDSFLVSGHVTSAEQAVDILIFIRNPSQLLGTDLTGIFILSNHVHISV